MFQFNYSFLLYSQAQQSTRVTTAVPKDVSRILIEGPIEEIASIPSEQLVTALKLLKDIEIVPDNHIIEVWKILKGNKSRESLSLEDIKKMNGYLSEIPDTDFFYFNMSNWDLVEYLGKYKKFAKHEVAILSASLIKTHGFGILNNHSCLNRMYGIICGFDPHLVKNIPDKEFLQINGEIFENLHACTQSQRRKKQQSQQFLALLKFGIPKQSIKLTCLFLP
ncbi:uncharacterized protein LOC123311953 isoform X2 [Coccinella septempunctata]|uniref:uncharacterized protein LOC123311953 isoform X2 n=1 Tax=Coccinella septempunctata TaxID=41139 RepID=UPI001D086DCE|nr:uncharacterized protein LOC123311953 isoform X2 [Coccinella septempunctata]